MPAWLLLAHGNPLEAVTRYLNRASSSREMLLAAVFALLIGTIWITLLFMERLRRWLPIPERAASPSVFESLCEAHHLSPADAALLQQAAAACQLASPSYLFIQFEHLDRLSGESLPQSAVYRQLRERLFG
jgi:hypothetical protein